MWDLVKKLAKNSYYKSDLLVLIIYVLLILVRFIFKR